MKRFGFLPLGLLALWALMALYSLTLVAIEFTTSHDQVRPYFTDIEGPVRLYAINTTLSMSLLWAGALLFCVVLLVISGASGNREERRFCVSQIAIFGYLGADDRFLLHEHLSDVLPMHDTMILLTVGIVEVAALVLWGDLAKRSVRARSYIFLAASLFLVMAAIDAFVPDHLTLRLSFEDLSKVWGALFLFLFAWEILETHVVELKDAAA